MLPGRLVRQFGELPDELLVQVAHLDVGHDLGVEVDLRELRHDHVEQVGVVEPDYLAGEVELVEHVTGAGREAGDVVAEVVGEVVGVVEQRLEACLEVLKNCSPDAAIRIGPLPSLSPTWDLASTVALVGSRT